MSAIYTTLREVGEIEAAGRANAEFVDLLANNSPILRTGYAEKCNDGRRHLTNMIKSITTKDRDRNFNEPYENSTLSSDTISHEPALFSDSIEEDCVLIDSMDDGAGSLRFKKKTPILAEQIGRDFETAVFYGSSKIKGLTGYYDSLGDETVIGGGGVAANAQTSIYAVSWGAADSSLIYPNGFDSSVKIGEVYKALAQETDITTGVRKGLPVYRQDFNLFTGLSLGDKRNCGRICNIDVAKLVNADTASGYVGRELRNLMIQLAGTLFNTYYDGNKRSSKTIFYVPRKFLTALAMISATSSEFGLRMEDWDGIGRVTMFGDIPLVASDQILETEAVVA